MAEPIGAGRPTQRVSWVSRIVGPLALIAVVVAAILIVNHSTGGDAGTSTTGSEGSAKTQKSKKDGPETPKTYAVQPGDSLSSIAAKFGVSVKRLERLNPNVDPQALSGEVKLR